MAMVTRHLRSTEKGASGSLRRFWGAAMTQHSNGGHIELLVIGRGEDGKPRAAKFPAARAALVGKAATAMGLAVTEIGTSAMAELVKKLPIGRLYANGKGFVPHIRPDQYAKALHGPGPGGRRRSGPSSPAVQAQRLELRQAARRWPGCVSTSPSRLVRTASCQPSIGLSLGDQVREARPEKNVDQDPTAQRPLAGLAEIPANRPASGSGRL